MTINYNTEISELIKQEDVDSLLDPVIEASNTYIYNVVEELNTQLNGGLSPDTLNFEGEAPLTEKGKNIVNSVIDLKSSFKSILDNMIDFANTQRQEELSELENQIEKYLDVVRNNKGVADGNVVALEECEDVDADEVSKWSNISDECDVDIKKYERKLDEISSEKSKLNGFTKS